MNKKVYITNQYILTRALPPFEGFPSGDDNPIRLYIMPLRTAIEVMDVLNAWKKSYGKFEYKISEVRFYPNTQDIYVFHIETQSVYENAKEELESKLEDVNSKIKDYQDFVLDINQKKLIS